MTGSLAFEGWKPPPRHRSHSIAFKRQVAQEYIGGETLHGLAKRHDLSRNLIRIWIGKYEAGTFDDDAMAADLVQEQEARIAIPRAARRAPGARAGVFKKGDALGSVDEKRAYIRDHRPASISVAQGCRLMAISRSSFYAPPADKPDDTKIVVEMKAIADEFEAYGYRRMSAELRQRGLVVNAKKVRRLMRENDLNPRHRRRYVATTDSDHDHPIFPNAPQEVGDGPNQLWVADITYVAIAIGFVYVAIVLDAWSQGRGLCDKPINRRQAGNRSPQNRHRSPSTTTRMHSPLRSRIAIRCRALSEGLGSPRPGRFDGAPWQSLRQCQG